jgi:hypothetical protein
MRRIAGLGMFWITLTMAVLSLPTPEAKKPVDPVPLGPIPIQVLTGKRRSFLIEKAMPIPEPRT